MKSSFDWAKEIRKIVSFIRSSARQAKKKKVVIGLSGGIDSAVVTALAVKAVGRDNVLTVILPYKTSSFSSMRDAKLLTKKFATKPIVVNISGQIDTYFSRFPKATQARRGNKIARERTAILYDIAYSNNALVLGTSNRSEFMLGYFTKFGDGACDVRPIVHLYKTEVRELAAHLNIPIHIIHKAPTADLWPGQTDEGEFGFSYQEADKILSMLIDQKMKASEIKKQGVNADLMRLIQQRIVSAEHKVSFPRSLERNE